MDVLCLGSEADVSIRRSFSKRNAFAMFLLKIEGGEKDKEVLSSCGHVNRDFESELQFSNHKILQPWIHENLIRNTP